MSEKLKPCPACGGSVQMTGGTEWHDQHEFWIECRSRDCGCVRVGDTEREECVRRWNALPRRQCWTKKKPTEPGWYWHNFLHNDTESAMCLITMLDGMLIANAQRRFQQFPVDAIHDSVWAGPIPAPED